MNVDWKLRVGGIDLLELRNLLQRATRRSHQPFDLDDLAKALAGFAAGSPKYLSKGEIAEQMPRAERILQVCAASGLVEVAKISYSDRATERDYSYALSRFGRSLLAAAKQKRITRARADQLVEKVLASANAINSDPSQLYDVERLSVFGSYLTDSPDLGDLDLAFTLSRRDDPAYGKGGSDEARRALCEAFEASHPAPESQSIEWKRWYEYRWHRLVPQRMLRVSRQVSLCQHYDMDSLGCPHMDIFPERISFSAKEGWTQRPPFRGLVDDGGAALRALRAETARLIRDDPAYRMGSGVHHPIE